MLSVEVKGLSKWFGRKKVVDGVSFSVKKGEIVGFLGPNGAGKTTILRMLLGLVRPSEGEIRLFGESLRGMESCQLRRVGGVTERPQFYPYLTAYRNLWLLASIRGGVGPERIREVLEAVGLTGEAHKRVGRFSFGMLQRLGIAQALLTDPDLIILDEPTNGLDPEGISWLRSLLRGLSVKGASLLISSHILHEVSLLCDRVMVIDSGRLVTQGYLRDILRGGEGLEDFYFSIAGGKGGNEDACAFNPH